jgi:hypothetical protein
MASSPKKRKHEEEEGAGETERYDLSDEQLLEIVRMVRANNAIEVPPTVFNLHSVRINRHFNNNEYVYEINIGQNNMDMLPEYVTIECFNISLI